MTYKQFRNANKIGLWMNDVAWAGRMYGKFPYWWSRLSRVVYVSLALGVLSLGAIWASILLRPPVLLLGVYPDGRVVCMPRVLDQAGNRVVRHKSYGVLCSTLFSKAGLEWMLDQSRQNDGQMPSTDPAAERPDSQPEFGAPVTSMDYIAEQLLARQAERSKANAETFVPLTPPTQAPPTQAPPTQAPPTQAPPTQAQPTQGE